MRIQTGRTCWMSICWLALIGMQANGWFNSGYGNGLLNSIALYTRWCIQGLIMSWQWDTLSTVINLLWLIPTQQKLTTWQTFAVTTPTMEFKTWWPGTLWLQASVPSGVRLDSCQSQSGGKLKSHEKLSVYNLQRLLPGLLCGFETSRGSSISAFVKTWSLSYFPPLSP